LNTIEISDVKCQCMKAKWLYKLLYSVFCFDPSIWNVSIGFYLGYLYLSSKREGYRS